jgi:hypothetical protein
MKILLPNEPRCSPQVSLIAIRGRGHARSTNLKELRPRVGGASEVRLLFVFDAAREAIILVAGDKTGRWSGWYAEAIPLAEERYAVYQRQTARRSSNEGSPLGGLQAGDPGA